LFSQVLAKLSQLSLDISSIGYPFEVHTIQYFIQSLTLTFLQAH